MQRARRRAARVRRDRRRAVRRRRPARDGRLVASRPRCCGARSRSSRSTSSTRRIRRRSGALQRAARPRAHALRRLLEVGHDARDALAPRLLLGAGRRPRRAVRRDHRSRLGARGARARARLPRDVFHGEPTIGGRYSALSPFGIVPAALMGVDVAALLERARRDGRGVPLRATATPGSSSGCALGEGWRDGPRQGLHRRRRRRASASGPSSCSPSRPASRARASCPRPGESPDGPDRQRGEVASRRRRTTSAQEFFRWEFATAVAGLDPRDQPVRPAGRPGGEGQDERGARRGQDADARAARARSTSCSRRRGRGRLRRDPGLRRPGARERSSSRSSTRARETGCVVTHRPRPALPALDGPAAQGRPEHRPLRPGRRRHRRGAADPRPRLRLRPADPRAGGGRLRGARGARPPRRPRQTGGRLVKLGMVGLGRMGSGMTERLERARPRRCRPTTRTSTRPRIARGAREAARAAARVWLMVPAGEITEDTFRKLLPILEPGDTIVDGGNSNFRDSQRRHAEARKQKAPLRRRRRLGRDLGARGRLLPDGRRRRRRRSKRLEPIFEALAPEDGWAHVGPSGAGHFAKMVHNGIEYGLMQAYAEGFELMHQSEFDARPRRDRRHLALRLGRPLVAARAPARGARAARRRARRHRAATSRTRARAAGRSTRRSTRACRCR